MLGRTSGVWWANENEILTNALTKVETKQAYLHFAKVFYNIRG